MSRGGDGSPRQERENIHVGEGRTEVGNKWGPLVIKHKEKIK